MNLLTKGSSSGLRAALGSDARYVRGYRYGLRGDKLSFDIGDIGDIGEWNWIAENSAAGNFCRVDGRHSRSPAREFGRKRFDPAIVQLYAPRPVFFQLSKQALWRIIS